MSIRYLFKPHAPVDVSTICTAVDGSRDFESFLTSYERNQIDCEWGKLVRKHEGKVFSKPRALGTLYDTSRNTLTFLPTDFKTYVSIARRSVDDVHARLNDVYNQMRVGAVGAAVRFNDGVYAVHRRPSTATHVPNMIDSSVAGLAFVNDENGQLRFSPLEDIVYSKLARELNLTKEQVSKPLLTGVHNSTELDYSGMFSFHMDANVPSSELERLANPAWMSDCYRVAEKDLPDFIIEHYAMTKDMSGDGAAVMLSALAPQRFLDTVKRIHGHTSHRPIHFGQLVDGSFKEKKLPWAYDGEFAPLLSSPELI